MHAVQSNAPLGLAQTPDVPAFLMTDFHGAPDTLNLMREHVWGQYGEKSVIVRMLTEEVVSDLKPKAYQSEVLAIRNFCTSRLRYLNDPLHVEFVKTPERIAKEIRDTGTSLCDCDEIAEMIATMALQAGRECEFVVVGFGAPGDYSHVFTRVKEAKSQEWVVCDPVAGSDERVMLNRVTTYEFWSLDDHEQPRAA